MEGLLQFEALIESAISHGAIEWAWTEHRHGVVFEVLLPGGGELGGVPARCPPCEAALDAVPDPVNGLLVYRGRGGRRGGHGRRGGRRPTAGAGAVELPEPEARARSWT